jgi:hypothetical protein
MLYEEHIFKKSTFNIKEDNEGLYNIIYDIIFKRIFT